MVLNAANPFIAGLRGRCPRCGQGALFSGFLQFAPACAACGLDYSGEDAGDGPAVFIIFIAGAILVPLALVVERVFTPPLWAHALIWTPLTLLICLGLLRPFRATLFALQHHNAAREARLDAGDGEQG